MCAGQAVWSASESQYFKLLIPARVRDFCYPKLADDDLGFCVGTKEFKVNFVKPR